MAQDTQSKTKATPKGVTKKGEIEIKRPTKKKPDQVVYVGPNLVGDLHIGQFTVFRDGLPAPVAAAVEADPILRRLFVPVAKAATARKELHKPSSPMNQAAQHAFKKYRQGGTK